MVQIEIPYEEDKDEVVVETPDPDMFSRLDTPCALKEQSISAAD